MLRRLDKLFNRLFTSQYNPLYSSGTIAVGLLFIAVVSGLYLCFFYRLGEPYESLAALQGDPWFGRWVRSLHRYASDALVVAVFVHIARMISQGKSWGPRTLAWLSGIGLLICLLISGWTGFVMVWDAQGQAVASAGARIMDSLGIFPDPISRSFDGSSPPPASFFFLNLFMHIVVPLAMIFGLWLHTSRMARATWFPQPKVMRGMCVAFVAISVIWPAPLGVKADLLAIPGSYPLDWFYNFWVPWAQIAPLATLAGFVAVTVLLASMPWWSKPAPAKIPGKSFNEQEKCQGCTQCVQDCPYEAITMVNRTKGSGSPMVALVNPDLCVSCGICAASCEPFTMGPLGRKGMDQFSASRHFLASLRTKGIQTKEQVLVLGCRSNQNFMRKLENFATEETGYQLYPTSCAGTVHAVVFELFAQQFKAVAVVACHPRSCTNKDGYKMLDERLRGLREPTFRTQENREKVHLMAFEDGEEKHLFRQLRALHTGHFAPHDQRRGYVPAAAALALVFGLASVGRITSSASPEHGLLRLSFRLSGQSEKTCRPHTPEEMKSLPQHMRASQLCTYKMLSYRFKLRINGQDHLEELVHPGGLHADRPLYVDRELMLNPGHHRIEIDLKPEQSSTAIHLELDEIVEVPSGGIALIHLSADQRKLLVKGVGHE